MQGAQNWIDGRKDGAAVAVGHDGLGDGRNDADGRLGSDLLKSLIDRSKPRVINNLGVLHSFPGCDVEPGHITPNICVTNDGDKPRHVDQAEVPA